MFVVVETDTESVYGPFETPEAALDAAFRALIDDVGTDHFEEYMKAPQKGPWPKSKEDYLVRSGLVVREVIEPLHM